ncbi:MAG: ROK family protein [Roseiflexaceae bacterium]
MQLRNGNRQLMRGMNRALVLRSIRDQGPIARSEIARVAQLSPATVSEITALLIDEGLVYECEAGVSTGGRRPILLALNQDAGLVVGVKLTESQLIVALTNLGAQVVDQHVAALGEDRSPATVATALAQNIHTLQRRHPDRRIFGIGLGLAGAIDRANGICRFSPFLQWRDVPIGPLLRERLRLPVVVENDVNTLTLAEQWFGSGQGEPDFLVVTVGRGVGMGMVLNGRLYRGGHGSGGELGHLTMLPDGPRCACGKHGCLEALVAEPALLQRLRIALGQELTLDAAVALVQQGDITARGIFTAAARTLGLALAHAVNLFNPPLIIIGGEGVRGLMPVFETLRETLAAHCFNGFFTDLRLVAEPWGDDAWARGAASLMLEEMFHGFEA